MTYKLINSEEEPSDEEMQVILKDVISVAMEKRELAHKALFSNMRSYFEKTNSQNKLSPR